MAESMKERMNEKRSNDEIDLTIFFVGEGTPEEQTFCQASLYRQG